ncbi:MAG: ArsR family transcriptional regulator [Sandaracinaceae bacterium]|nr:MAG: ArsR family transcriptional regulator [Sandaracinaceae bacterium]
MGNTIPILGTPTSPSGTIADALFTATQQRVLALLYGQPERELTVSELIALASIGSGSVQRELSKLSAAGLVEARRDRGRSLYRANKQSPVFEDLRGLVVKTMGIRHQVEGALAPIADRIVLAVIFGSEAKATATASSDVDLLLVVDDLTLEEVHAALEPLERRLGRRIDPTVYTREEFTKRRQSDHPFLRKVLAGPHMVLLGSEDVVEGSR